MEVPGHIRSVFIQNGVKLFARLSTACLEKEDDRGLVKVSFLYTFKHINQFFTVSNMATLILKISEISKFNFVNI